MVRGPQFEKRWLRGSLCALRARCRNYRMKIENKILDERYDHTHTHTYIYIHICYSRIYTYICGHGTSVAIATDYNLEGPGSNPGGDEIYRLFGTVLEPTQPPVKWVPCLSQG